MTDAAVNDDIETVERLRRELERCDSTSAAKRDLDRLAARLQETERERDEAREVLEGSHARGYKEGVIEERKRSAARAEAAELRVAALQDGLALYGRHLRRCACSKWTPEDNYQPVCDCDLDALLAEDGAE